MTDATDDLARLREQLAAVERERDHWLAQAQMYLKNGQECLDTLEASTAQTARLRERVEMLTAELKVALEVMESAKGNIDPERGYADEVEADISAVIEKARALLQEPLHD